MLATRVHRKNCSKTSCAHSALRPCAIQMSVVTFCLEILLMKVSKKAANQVFLLNDRSSSQSSFKKANSRGKCIDVRLFITRMVILYLKTFLRYGPLLDHSTLPVNEGKMTR